MAKDCIHWATLVFAVLSAAGCLVAMLFVSALGEDERLPVWWVLTSLVLLMLGAWMVVWGCFKVWQAVEERS